MSASTLFQAVARALQASRADRKHAPKHDTEFSITAPNCEERIVRYSSLARHLPFGQPETVEPGAIFKGKAA